MIHSSNIAHSTLIKYRTWIGQTSAQIWILYLFFSLLNTPMLLAVWPSLLTEEVLISYPKFYVINANATDDALSLINQSHRILRWSVLMILLWFHEVPSHPCQKYIIGETITGQREYLIGLQLDVANGGPRLLHPFYDPPKLVLCCCPNTATCYQLFNSCIETNCKSQILLKHRETNCIRIQ